MAAVGTAYVDFAGRYDKLLAQSKVAGTKAGAAAGTGASGAFASKTAGMGMKAFAGLAAGAAVAGAALFKIGADFDKAYDKIIVGTGASGKALDGLKDSFKNVLKGSASSFEDTSTAIADLNTALGLTGKPLEDLSKQMLDMSRMTGSDLSSNIKNVTRLFGDWGVATDDQGLALDKVFLATQETGIGIDKLAESVVKYGAPMRALGYTFEESLAIFGKWNKEGVNTEVIMGGVRSAIGKFSRAGLDVPESFKGALQTIQDFGSDSEATGYAVEVFGQKAGSDLAMAVREGRFEVDDLAASLMGADGAINDAAEATRSFGEMWTIVKNNVLVGLEPLASAVFNGVGTAMAALMDRGSQLKSILQPAIENIMDSFRHLGDIAKIVFDTLSPFAEALLKLGGMAVIGAILGLAAGFEAVAEWIAKNESLVEGLTLVFAGLAGVKVFTVLAAGFQTLAAKAALSAGNIKASMTSAFTGMSAAFAVASIGIMTIFEGITSAASDARAQVEELKPPDFDDRSLESWETYSRRLNLAALEAENSDKKHDGLWNTLRGGVELVLPGVESGAYNSAIALREMGDAAQEVGGFAVAVDATLQELARRTGLTTSEVQEALLRFDLDPMEKSQRETAEEIMANLTGLATEAGYAGDALIDAVSLSPAELEEQKKQWEALSKSVSDAWTGQLSLLGSLGGEVDLTQEKIETWYALNVSRAQTFSQNIATAIKAGYDPVLISELLQAGPAQAAPLLQTMVDNHESGLVDIVNSGQEAITDLSTLAVEMARITNLAMNAQTDEMTRNMGDGLRVAEAVSRMGAFATASAVAEELGKGAGEVAGIAELYGISLVDAINPILEGVGKSPLNAVRGMRERFRRAQGLNSGGFVEGPNVDRDVIPAMLTPGEVVINKDMTRKWGTQNLLDLNEGRFPRGWSIPGYNRGGRVTGKTAGLHPELLKRLTMWSAAVGQPYNVGSGYRSVAEQVPLYQKYLAGKGPVAAVPGSSYHNFGLASDGNHWRNRNPGAFGLVFNVPSEAWHVQPTDARALKGGSAHGFVPPLPLPEPPKIGDYLLGRTGEYVMEHAYKNALEWAQAQMMSYGDPGMASMGGASSAVRSMVQGMAARRGWVGPEWAALDRLVQKESSWNPNAQNPTSTAYGLFQFLNSTWGKYGKKTSDPAAQARAGFAYISDRYGSPSKALAFHNRNNWYNDGGEVFRHKRTFDNGGTLEKGLNLVDNQTGAPEPLVPAGAGVTVNIDQLHQHDGVDVDLLVQRVAGLSKAGRA